jgi:2-polyprenyl-6-methoxyphenol hydroxylase-like FAD-dependent oxidoreductase
MSLDGKHVVVAGGGVSGSATALLAARAGARVTLVEEDAEARDLATGILLQPNGLAVLYGLGLEERLHARGTPLNSLRVADGLDRTIIQIEVPRFADGLDHALVVRRDVLGSALQEAVVAEPRIERRAGTQVLKASPRGAVLLRARGAPEHIVADVVVAADGVNSWIRRSSGLAARVACGLRYVRGLGSKPPRSGMTEYWTALGVFGVAPLDGGSYFYASTRAEPLARALRDRNIDLFRDTWRRALPLAGEVLADVERTDDLLASWVVHVYMRHWTKGRIALVGDAAHAMAPNLGQGASSALADAAVLVWELARPGATAAALARYERRRRPAVRAAQDAAGLLGRLSDLSPAALRVVRDGTIRLLGPWLLGELGTRLVEQPDPLWLRLASENPTDAPAVRGEPERAERRAPLEAENGRRSMGAFRVAR